MSKRQATLAELIESCRQESPDKPNILKTLLIIQRALGHVPVAAIQQVSQALEVTDADVAGVLSYYPDLRTEAPGRHVIRTCMGESCMANHCPAVLRAVEAHLGDRAGQTASGARFTLEKVYCLGNCALSPTVVVDQDIYGRVEPAQIPPLLERYR